ncbi:PepSY domain-containing protein [Pontibacillus sp. HMF3514]|uniref:PepSY domain-containing protein n=1 Tax=Pontibacillus sp. HMF3514 TaxID=2692425 RepID=UPI001F3CAF31|nr:PepSY domain-containing protein [Pontibacillus sp. HMF3514]
MVFLYEHQKPVLSTSGALIQAVKCLNDPPEDLGIRPMNIEVDTLTSEHISKTHLVKKIGLWNSMTNHREWEITLKINGKHPTVIVDAYTGECVSVYGPLS